MNSTVRVKNRGAFRWKRFSLSTSCLSAAITFIEPPHTQSNLQVKPKLIHTHRGSEQRSSQTSRSSGVAGLPSGPCLIRLSRPQFLIFQKIQPTGGVQTLTFLHPVWERMPSLLLEESTRIQMIRMLCIKEFPGIKKLMSNSFRKNMPSVKVHFQKE
jgi:hypothetical protein